MPNSLTITKACIGVHVRPDGSVRMVLHHGGLPLAIDMTRAEADELGRSLLAEPDPHGSLIPDPCPLTPAPEDPAATETANAMPDEMGLP